MADLNVEWCDFVVFSGRAVAVERILFNLDYWQETLLPKLQSFDRHHIAKEILSGEYFFEMCIVADTALSISSFIDCYLVFRYIACWLKSELVMIHSTPFLVALYSDTVML